LREERRQSFGAVGVEEAVDATLGDRTDLGGRDGQEVSRKRQRLAVKVAVRLHVAVLEYDRIVDRRRELDRGRSPREVERVARSPGDLRTASHRVGILDGVGGVTV